MRFPSPFSLARLPAHAWFLLCLLPATLIPSALGSQALSISPAIEIRFASPPGQWIQLQQSTNLISWNPALPSMLSQAGESRTLLPAPDANGSFRLVSSPVRDLTDTLEPIRSARRLPALGCVVIQSNLITGLGVVGVRKWNVNEPATISDKWHHGSITKSITATLAAVLVSKGHVHWTQTLAEVFPDKASAMNAAWHSVSLESLLANRGGAPGNLNAGGLWNDLWAFGGTPRQARILLLDRVTAVAPSSTPGSQYEYSNAGFAIAGAMLEQVMNRPWEDLIREHLFIPLGMASGGFGVPATPRYLDQPWGHTLSSGNPSPVPPGTDADNPPAIGPAGTVHASLTDLARYVALHLAGARGEATPLLDPASFLKLHSNVANQGYALGWNVGSRPWAGGRVLSHTGSNVQWFTNIWIAPEKNWACIVVTNFGGQGAFEATDAVVAALIPLFL
jgi:CubicO group peptidase (beta-lactamase class C family)